MGGELVGRVRRRVTGGSKCSQRRGRGIQCEWVREDALNNSIMNTIGGQLLRMKMMQFLHCNS